MNTYLVIFPIGLLTGALTNLDVAVCSNPDTNSLYWCARPWQGGGGQQVQQPAPLLRRPQHSHRKLYTQLHFPVPGPGSATAPASGSNFSRRS